MAGGVKKGNSNWTVYNAGIHSKQSERLDGHAEESARTERHGRTPFWSEYPVRLLRRLKGTQCDALPFSRRSRGGCKPASTLGRAVDTGLAFKAVVAVRAGLLPARRGYAADQRTGCALLIRMICQ